MEQIKAFLFKPVVSLNGFQVTVGMVLVAAVVVYLVYKAKR